MNMIHKISGFAQYIIYFILLPQFTELQEIKKLSKV